MIGFVTLQIVGSLVALGMPRHTTDCYLAARNSRPDFRALIWCVYDLTFLCPPCPFFLMAAFKAAFVISPLRIYPQPGYYQVFPPLLVRDSRRHVRKAFCQSIDYITN